MAVTRQVTLADGRRLGFAVYGAPQGRPILFFHGWPSSRYEAQLIAPTAQKIVSQSELDSIWSVWNS